MPTEKHNNSLVAKTRRLFENLIGGDYAHAKRQGGAPSGPSSGNAAISGTTGPLDHDRNRLPDAGTCSAVGPAAGAPALLLRHNPLGVTVLSLDPVQSVPGNPSQKVYDATWCDVPVHLHVLYFCKRPNPVAPLPGPNSPHPTVAAALDAPPPVQANMVTQPDMAAVATEVEASLVQLIAEPAPQVLPVLACAKVTCRAHISSPGDEHVTQRVMAEVHVVTPQVQGLVPLAAWLAERWPNEAAVEAAAATAAAAVEAGAGVAGSAGAVAGAVPAAAAAAAGVLRPGRAGGSAGLGAGSLASAPARLGTSAAAGPPAAARALGLGAVAGRPIAEALSSHSGSGMTHGSAASASFARNAPSAAAARGKKAKKANSGRPPAGAGAGAGGASCLPGCLAPWLAEGQGGGSTGPIGTGGAASVAALLQSKEPKPLPVPGGNGATAAAAAAPPRASALPSAASTPDAAGKRYAPLPAAAAPPHQPQLPLPEALDLLIGVGEALRSLHRRGLTHGAISPCTIRLQLLPPQLPVPPSASQQPSASGGPSPCNASPATAALVPAKTALVRAAAECGEEPAHAAQLSPPPRSPHISFSSTSPPAPSSGHGTLAFAGPSDLPRATHCPMGLVPIHEAPSIAGSTCREDGDGGSVSLTASSKVSGAPGAGSQPATPRLTPSPKRPSRLSLDQHVAGSRAPSASVSARGAEAEGHGSKASQAQAEQSGSEQPAAAPPRRRRQRMFAVLPLPAVGPAMLQLQTWGRIRPTGLTLDQVLWCAPELVHTGNFAPQYGAGAAGLAAAVAAARGGGGSIGACGGLSLGWNRPGDASSMAHSHSHSLSVGARQHSRRGPKAGKGPSLAQQIAQSHINAYGDGSYGGSYGGGGGAGGGRRGKGLAAPLVLQDLPTPTAAATLGISPACDVYSLGMMMWYLVAGRPPLQHLAGQEDVVRVKELGWMDSHLPFSPQLPLAYVQLARRCWAAAPLQRPPIQVALHELRCIRAELLGPEAAGAASPAELDTLWAGSSGFADSRLSLTLSGAASGGDGGDDYLTVRPPLELAFGAADRGPGGGGGGGAAADSDALAAFLGGGGGPPTAPGALPASLLSALTAPRHPGSLGGGPSMVDEGEGDFTDTDRFTDQAETMTEPSEPGGGTVRSTPTAGTPSAGGATWRGGGGGGTVGMSGNHSMAWRSGGPNYGTLGVDLPASAAAAFRATTHRGGAGAMSRASGSASPASAASLATAAAAGASAAAAGAMGVGRTRSYTSGNQPPQPVGTADAARPGNGRMAPPSASAGFGGQEGAAAGAAGGGGSAQG